MKKWQWCLQLPLQAPCWIFEYNQTWPLDTVYSNIGAFFYHFLLLQVFASRYFDLIALLSFFLSLLWHLLHDTNFYWVVFTHSKYIHLKPWLYIYLICWLFKLIQPYSFIISIFKTWRCSFEVGNRWSFEVAFFHFIWCCDKVRKSFSKTWTHFFTFNHFGLRIF